MSSIQKNAIGVDLIGTIAESGVTIDVSTTTTRQIFLKKPSGSIINRSAILLTDGTDGKIVYRTIAGDIDVAGTWSIQGYVVFPGGFDGRSEVVTFQVLDNL